MYSATNQLNPDFVAIAENSQHPLFVVIRDNGKIVYCNHQSTDLTGYSPEELVNRVFSAVFHPREMVHLTRINQSQTKSMSPPDYYVTKIIAKGDRVIPVEMRARKTTWCDQPADLIALHDATNHLQFEDRSRLQSRMLDAIDETVIAMDSTGIITYASINESARRLHGWRPDKIIGTNVLNIIASEFGKEVDGIIHKVLHGESWSGVMPIRATDGKIFQSLTYLSPVVDGRGQVVSVMGVSIELKEAPPGKSPQSPPSRCQSPLQRQAQMLGSTGLGVMAADLKGIICYVSEPGLEATGWTSDQTIGKSIFDFLPLDFQERALDILKLISTSQPWSGVICIRLANDNYLQRWCFSGPVFNEQGETIGFIAISAEIKNPRKALGRLYELIENEKSRPNFMRQECILETLNQVLSRYKEDCPHFSPIRAESLPVAPAEKPLSPDSPGAVGEAVVITDRYGTITSISGPGLLDRNWGKDELIGHNLVEFILPDALGKVTEIIRPLRSGNQWHGEVPFLDKHGRITKLVVTVDPILDKGGKLAGSRSVIVGVEDQKQLEDPMRVKARMMEAVVEGIATDQNGIINYISDIACRETGWNKNEVLGRHVSAFSPAEFHARADEIRNVLLDKQDYVGEFPVICKNGNVLTCQARVSPILNDKGEVIGTINVTLKEENKAPIKIFDTPVEGITSDLEAIIRDIGDEICKIAGWRKEDLIGRNVIYILAPEFHPRIPELVNFAHRNKIWSDMMPFICGDGRILEVWGATKPVTDAKGKVVKITSELVAYRERFPEAVDKNLSTPAQPDTAELLQEFQTRFQAAKEQLNKISEALSHGEHLFQQVQSVVKSTQNKVALPPKAEIDSFQPRLDVYCLGAFKVCSPTQQIQQWPSLRARSVFEYLIAKLKSSVGKDVLMDTLWPEYNSRAAANNLKTSIHDLRQILSSLFDHPDCPCILFSQGAYTLNPKIEINVDADEFERLWARAKMLEKDGNISAAIQELEKAEALYQGDYLEDQLYEEWTISRRETLKDIYLLLLNKLADHSMNNSDYESCITYCHKILGKDNCCEDAYRMLMICYSRFGQKNNSFRWYENCRQTLKNELNVDLASETVDLYHRLVKGETI